MVYLPMGYLYGQRFRAEETELVKALRAELYPTPYDEIHWPAQRNHVAAADLYAPHTRMLDALFCVLGQYERVHIGALREAGMRRAYELIVKEDINTSYQCLGPVNKMLNYIVRWIVDGPASEAMARHREKLRDFVWMSADGLMMTGTNGSQLWDTSFIAQAMCDAGRAREPP